MTNKFQDPKSDKVQNWLNKATDKNGRFEGSLDHVCIRDGKFVASDGFRLHTVALRELKGSLYQSDTFISDNLPWDECPICAQRKANKRYLTADNIKAICDLERKGNTIIRVNRKELVAALRKSANTNAKESRVEIVVDKDGVRIGEQKLDCLIPLKMALRVDVRQTFSARYLHQAIGGMGDEIDLRFRYYYDPVQITDGQLTAVVMPVRMPRAR